MIPSNPEVSAFQHLLYPLGSVWIWWSGFDTRKNTR